MSLLSNSTFENPTTPFFALASQSADKWYTFPSKTGQVILQDASGLEILQSIDGNLFYNQELLARAGDIQDIADYSLYPVINPAGVDFNGNPLTNASTITASGDISGGSLSIGGDVTIGGSIIGDVTVGGNVSAGGILSGTEVSVTGAIQGGSLSVATIPQPFTSGNIQADTLSLSGLASVGSVDSVGRVSAASATVTGNIIAGSLTTTGGLDMANSSITRASSVNISNAGFAPYGQLTSPNGTQLLWNGSAINTGGGGDVSQWANFNAIAPVNLNSNPINNASTIASLGTITAGGKITTATDISAGGILNVTGDITTGANVYAQATPGAALFTNNVTQLYDPVNNKAMLLQAQNPAGVFLNSLSGGIALTAAAGKIESTATDDINLTTTAGDVNVTVYNSATINTGNDVSIKADPGLNPLYTGAINLTAQNGNQGQVNIIANPGSVVANGGKVLIQANGGTTYIPQPPPAPPTPVTVGGLVEIDANTGSGGLYTLTSAIKMSAAGINSYAGAIPSIGSLAGYNFIYGTAGVNICAGLPSAGFQYAGTIYQYAIGSPLYGGIRLESPFGIQMLSNTYIENLYPLDGNGLTIQGRSLPTGYVTIKDLAQLTMNPATALQTDRVTSVSNLGILFQDAIQATTIEPPMATAAGTPNLLIKGNENILGGYQNYVQIQNADTIAFDATGTGALSGVQSINGAAWPPPTGDASLWSQYPQSSTLDASGYGIINLTTINGAPYPPAGPDDWYNIPAGANVDISGFDLNNVNNLTMPDNGVIVSAGQLSIFADLGKNLNIATNGGGDLNLGTGNAGDINIITSGTGNELNLGGDIVNINATQGVRISAPLDMVGNNIIDVAILRGSLNTDMTVSTNGTGTLNLQSDTGSTIISSTDAVNVNAGTGVDITAIANDVQLNAGVGLITLNAPTTRMLGAATVGGTLSATGDVVSSSAGSTPYSLNTVGALVSGNQQFNYWVSVNGSDTTGTGSAIRPFASVTAALAATLSIPSSTQCNINIAAGTYTENPTITRNNTFLVGNVGVADAVIVGTLTFDCADISTISQGITGITVVGNVVCTETASVDVTWYIQHCNITSYGTVAISAVSTGAGNNSLTMYNTVVTQNVTANSAITLNTVRLNMIQCQVNNTTTGSAISCSGTGSMSLFGATLTCSGSSAVSASIVSFLNNLGNGSASSFTLCSFTYTSATVGAGKSAFFFNNGGALAGATTLNQNIFALPGAAALLFRPGIGSVAITFGTNTSSILTIPAAGSGLTYTYLTSTPLRANVLYDSASSAGTANQVLGAGSAGGTLTWRSLTNQSLGSIPSATNAAVYQNQPLFYNTATQSINYIAAGDDVIVQPCPASANPVASQRGITYIATSAAGGANFQFANGGGLTANDAGWYIYIKNGNPNAGGDITLTGALVSGNTVIHQGTALQNGGITILTWNGTAYVAY